MKINFFNISLTTVMLRFYLLMAVIIIPLFAGIPALAILALPIFIITILGVEFKIGDSRAVAKVKQITQKEKIRRAV